LNSGFGLTLPSYRGFFANMNSLRLGFFSFLFAAHCTASGFSLNFDFRIFGAPFSNPVQRILADSSGSFSGIISIDKGQTYLIAETGHAKFTLTPMNKEIKAQISRLKTGDFLSFEGYIDQQNSILYVSSVNYVGLKDLLGNWFGDDEYCYKFKNFNSLSIFNKADNKKCDFSVSFLAREFSYFINPSDLDWSVLLSDNDDSYLMDLTLNSKNSAELSLYDSRSGDILRQIRIRR